MNTTVLSVVVIGELAKLAGYEWLWIGRQTWIETLGVLTLEHSIIARPPRRGGGAAAQGSHRSTRRRRWWTLELWPTP